MTHIPRHNPRRAEKLANHVPWWQRVPYRSGRFVGGTAALIAVVLVLGGHTAGLMHAASEHPHAEAVAEPVTPQHCLEALARADDAFEQAEKFGKGMQDFHAGALDLLRRGDEGHAVEQLQKYLNEEADADLRVDGSFGRETEQAVEAYREAQGRHKADSKDFLAELADVRERYETAKLGCQLRPPEPTTGGG